MICRGARAQALKTKIIILGGMKVAVGQALPSGPDARWHDIGVYFTSTPSSTRVLDTSSVAKC